MPVEELAYRPGAAVQLEPSRTLSSLLGPGVVAQRRFRREPYDAPLGPALSASSLLSLRAHLSPALPWLRAGGICLRAGAAPAPRPPSRWPRAGGTWAALAVPPTLRAGGTTPSAGAPAPASFACCLALRSSPRLALPRLRSRFGSAPRGFAAGVRPARGSSVGVGARAGLARRAKPSCASSTARVGWGARACFNGGALARGPSAHHPPLRRRAAVGGAAQELSGDESTGGDAPAGEDAEWAGAQDLQRLGGDCTRGKLDGSEVEDR